MSHDRSDAELMRAVAANDRRAFQTLYMRHHVPVFRYLMGFLRERGAAEDALHDVFLEVWRKAGTFDGRASVSTWMIAIARFKAIDALRKRRGETAWDERADQRRDEGATPETAAMTGDKARAIARCLDSLSLEHREIVDLVYYHGKTVREVSVIVGIPENTVKTRMFHARRKLKDSLIAMGIDAKWP